ncbi:NifB/NifX family molybdenum-iron cluster-binding protein [Desulfovulcanus sp.]
MKIAISAQSNSLDSPVDSRFGRAQGFIVYDLDTDEFEYVPNAQNMGLPQGAGIQAAQNVAQTGAKAVITGHVGPKAFLALEKGGIEVYFGGTRTVAQAIEDFRSGKLEKAQDADKPGHW